MPHSMPCMQNQHSTRIQQLDFDVFQDVLLDSTSMVYLPAPAAGFYIVYWFVLFAGACGGLLYCLLVCVSEKKCGNWCGNINST